MSEQLTIPEPVETTAAPVKLPDVPDLKVMPIGHQRLLRTAEILEALPTKNFDIRLWKHEGELDCGTVACALGWAASDKEFNKQGLFLKRSWWGGQAVPNFRNAKGYIVATGYNAAVEFYGIAIEDAHRFFSPVGYRDENPRPKTVAKRLRRYVASH